MCVRRHTDQPASQGCRRDVAGNYNIQFYFTLLFFFFRDGNLNTREKKITKNYYLIANSFCFGFIYLFIYSFIYYLFIYNNFICIGSQ